ncbi:HAMP domain-containing protein [Candidatus Woesearchaeota archaeon]|nr:HAMP domain-containing protein [Candidatus Woesearchaeota archaeon]
MFMVSFLGLGILCMTAYLIIEKIKVNGPIYQQVITGKDIIADVLPPPEYILESLLVVYSADASRSLEEKKDLLDQFKKLKQAYDERHDFWQAELAEDPIKRALVIDSYEPATRFYDRALNGYFPALLDGKTEVSDTIFRNELLSAYQLHRQQIDRVVNLTEARNREIETRTNQTIDHSILTLALIAAGVSLLSVVISWLVSRSITRPVEACMQAARQLASGNMNVTLETGAKGEIGQLQAAMQTMADAIKALATDAELLSNAAREGQLTTRAETGHHQGDFKRIIQGFNETLDSLIAPLNNIGMAIQSLGNNDLSVMPVGEYRGYFRHVKESYESALININTTLLQIVEAVEEVVATAEKLSTVSQNLASTAEEQSASVEQVTASVAETDHQIKANTDNARAANQVVMATAEAAEQGNLKMETMMSAMNSINHSSHNIAKIIKVIDEIAFQTNLLALNAAVEAARAGQHGRGFAVVAMEVRNLAGRSAKAARETADMIEHSTQRVHEGVGIANETRDALNRIVGNVVRVKDLVGEIAAASSEQSLGISQITIAMNEVSNAAQLSSQQAETMASASSLLTRVTGQILRDVNRFKLRNHGGKRSAPVPALDATPATTGVPLQSERLSNPPRKPAVSLTPRDILPLDQDERGFANF